MPDRIETFLTQYQELRDLADEIGNLVDDWEQDVLDFLIRDCGLAELEELDTGVEMYNSYPVRHSYSLEEVMQDLDDWQSGVVFTVTVQVPDYGYLEFDISMEPEVLESGSWWAEVSCDLIEDLEGTVINIKRRPCITE